MTKKIRQNDAIKHTVNKSRWNLKDVQTTHRKIKKERKQTENRETRLSPRLSTVILNVNSLNKSIKGRDK